MKQLPKYFVIKRDEENPLWMKYIKWINKEYDIEFSGSESIYYGYDGGISYKGCTPFISDYLGHFQDATLITLEEWNECINGERIPEVSKTIEEFKEGEIVEVRDCDNIWKERVYMWTDSKNIHYAMSCRRDYEIQGDNIYSGLIPYTEIRKLQKTTVTKQEIADWKGCDVNNLDIKD